MPSIVIVRAIALLAFTCVPALLLNAEPVMQRAADTNLTLSGPVQRYTNAVVTKWLLRASSDNPAILQMFADRDHEPYRNLLPWSGEFAGKYLTGMVQVLRLTGDDRLRQHCAEFVRHFIALQDMNGYLGPFPQQYQLSGKAPNSRGGVTWDAWGHYHAMMGLLLWHEESGDPQALAAARRIGDLLCATFLDTGRTVSSTGSVEMNQAIAHSLALLYKQTGEERYLKLTKAVVADFSAPGAGDFLRQGARGTKFYQLPKPRWESLHPVMALAELYWITGDDEYRNAFENLWWSIAEFDRHNNGGFSSGEKAQGNPFHPGAIETCCTIAWMAMSVEMLKMTGDSRVADELELSTFNQVLGLHSPDGKWCTYNTPMNGSRVPSTIDIAFQIRPGSEELNCCSVNAARGLGMIGDWALMHNKKGLVLNWYGPSKMVTSVEGTRVTLTQTTDYPVSGHIVVEVESEQPKKFPLALRIPHWSAKTGIFVNNQPQSAKAGSYVVVDREWGSGDRVEIDLDMSPRFWAGERECEGLVSIYYGPILLAFEHPKNSSLKLDEHWGGNTGLRHTTYKGAEAIFEFEGDAVEWHGAKFDDAGKASVTIDNGKPEIVDQYGPKRNSPFVWRREGLEAGKHTLRLKVLGQKSDKSKNTYVNLRTFKAGMKLPELDARELASNMNVEPSGSGILTVSAQDRTGTPLRLRDFGSAGQGGISYSTWLPVRGVSPTAFSKENPSRTTRTAD